MTSVINLAELITKVLGEVSVMKMQRLCYYCQAWNLAWRNEPLFDEDFVAWRTGPVCPELERALREPVDVPAHSWNRKDLTTIVKVLRSYGDKDANWLAELSRLERPWQQTISTRGVGKVIRKADICEYYQNLPA